MKKSIVALAIAAAAVSGAANAKFDVYNNDGLSVQLSGEVAAHMITSKTKAEAKEYNDGTGFVPIPSGIDTTLKGKEDPNVYGYGKIQVDTQYRISSSTTAFGSFELESDGSDVVADDVVIGFENDAAGTFSFGETGHSLAVLEKTDITEEAPWLGAVGHPTESAGKGVRWQKDISGVTLSADIQTSRDSEGPQTDLGKDGYGNVYAISADWAVNDVFTVGVAYADAGSNSYVNEKTGLLADYDVNTYGISASAQLDNLYLAATVSQYNGFDKITNDRDDNIDLEAVGINTDARNNTNGLTYGVAVAYQLDATNVYATYSAIEADEFSETETDSDASVAAITVGASHELTNNVKVYAEYTNLSVDNIQKETYASELLKGDITEDIFMVGGKFTF